MNLNKLKNILTKEISLTDSNIKKNLFFFALPIAFTTLLQLFFNMSDQFIIAHSSNPDGYTAISSTAVLTSLVVSLLSGFSIGANVLLANAVGKKDKQMAKRIIDSTFFLVFIVSIVMAITCCLLSRKFLELLGTPQLVIDSSTTFLTIYFASSPFIMLYDCSAALLRGMGDSKKPFYVLTSAGIINVLLALLFVLVLNMDVKGVALATFISQGYAGIVTCLILYFNKGFARLDFKNFHPHKNDIIEILKIGIPASIQGGLFAIPNMIMQSNINALDLVSPGFAGGSNAAYQLESFLNTSQNCFGQGCIAFVAANYGARNIKQIKQSILYSLIYGIGVSIVLGLIFYLLRVQLLNLFISGYKHKENGLEYYQNALKAGSLRATTDYLTYGFYAIVDCIPYALRGLKHSTLTMIISLIGICGLRVIFLEFIFPIETFHTATWLFLVFPISWVITAFFQIVTLMIVLKKTFKKIEKENSLRN